MDRFPTALLAELKRNHLLALVLIALASLECMLLDWMVARHVFGALFAVRLPLVIFCGAMLLWGARRPPEQHLGLIWATLTVLAVSSSLIVLMSGEISYLIILSLLILPCCSALFPLPRRRAAALFGMVQTLTCFLPFPFLYPKTDNEAFAQAGLMAGAALLGLAVYNSGRGYKLRLADAAARERLEAGAGELARLLERDRARVRDLRGAAAALTQLTGSLRGSTDGLRGEAAQLAEAYGRLREAIASRAREDDRVAETVAGIDEKVQRSRAEVESFERWEKQSAAPTRERLRADTEEMSGAAAEIGSICEVVASIARQSRILALNAGIETAGAGQGSQFHAIAASMLRFADGVRDRSAQIGESVEALSADAAQLQRKLETYCTSSARASARLNDNVATTQRIAARLAQLNETAQSLATVSSQQAASVELMAQSADALQASVQTLEAAAERLARTAQALSTSLDAGEERAA